MKKDNEQNLFTIIDKIKIYAVIRELYSMCLEVLKIKFLNFHTKDFLS
jgi:hypothetical protein